MIRPMAFAFVAVAFGFAASNGYAAIISNGSGNTNPGDLEIDGTINFAVYNRGLGSGTDTFGTGLSTFDTYFDQDLSGPGATSGGFDVNANYLYLFQVVNDGSVNHAIVEAVIDTYGSVTSWGVFEGLGFGDAQGKVGDTVTVGSNTFVNRLGNDSSAFGDPDTYSNNAIASIVMISDGKPGVNTRRTVYPGGSSPGKFRMVFNDLDDGLIGGARTYLIGFTSNERPAFVTAAILGSSADGKAAGPSTGTAGAPPVLPEPASMAIWSLGLAMVGGVGAWRRRRLKAAA
jgi:hypothetical protein